MDLIIFQEWEAWPIQEFAKWELIPETLVSKDVYHKLNTLFQLFQAQELIQTHQLEVRDQQILLKAQTLLQELEEVVWFIFHLPTLKNNINHITTITNSYNSMNHLKPIKKKPPIKKSGKPSKRDYTLLKTILLPLLLLKKPPKHSEIPTTENSQVRN